MPRKPLSLKRRKQIASAIKATYQVLALEAYREELGRKDLGLYHKGVRTICREFVQRCKRETGHVIVLNHQTILNYHEGKPSRAMANAFAKAWLNPDEVEVVLEAIIEFGFRKFPLSHKRLKEHVDEILHEKFGPNFPGVGKNWTYRFVEKHSDRLRTAWASPHEAKRGRAVNEHTIDAYFDLLEVELEDIDDDLIYAVDEMGVNGTDGQRERVIIGKDTVGPAHQQVGGSRENITVIVTICADGTSLKPTAILKGQAFLVKWKQDNPLNASLGYSKKGWTTGEIGVEWIKDFDNQTKAKAAGRPRLLLVDGHNSHYTRAFLSYAREANIRVLCYPAHTTHVLQGLDVVIFGSLKKAIREERDAYERSTGDMFGKTNFLGIYGRAHIQVMKSDTIKSAFRATGVCPFDRTVITPEMMAASKETSCQGALPVVCSTPIRVLGQLIGDLAKKENHTSDDAGLADSDANPFLVPETIPEDVAGEAAGNVEGGGAAGSPTSTARPTSLSKAGSEGVACEGRAEEGAERGAVEGPAHDVEALIAQAVARLRGSALDRLVSSFTCRTNRNAPVQPARPTPRLSDQLKIDPTTPRKAQLLAALRQKEDEAEASQRRVLELQAINVLNEAYCAAMSKKLASKEEKKTRGKGKGRLMGDGLPVLVTGDYFYERVLEFEREQVRKEARREARGDAQVALERALKEWEESEVERKAAIEQRYTEWEKEKADFAAAKQRWQQDKLAGTVKGAFRGTAPKRGDLPKARPKPKLLDFIADSEASEGEDFGGSDDDE